MKNNNGKFIQIAVGKIGTAEMVLLLTEWQDGTKQLKIGNRKTYEAISFPLTPARTKRLINALQKIV